MTRDAPQRTRSCRREQPAATTSQSRGSRPICLPPDRETYDRIWDDPQAVRLLVEEPLSRHPEPFPKAMTRGFTLGGERPRSQKRAGVGLRRVRVTGTDDYGRATIQDSSLRPSFVSPYRCGTIDDVEKGMPLLSDGVPYHVVPSGFGRDPMSRYRLRPSLGRDSLVGTTARDPDASPQHLAADEPHAPWRGEDASVAMTAGNGRVLGMAVSPTANEVDLTAASGRFRDEAGAVSAESAPETVTTDGWTATQAAWRTLFPKVVLISRFWHGSLKVRDRCREAPELHGQVWEV